MATFAKHAKWAFEEYLEPRFAGKPVQYLEIGTWRGASAKWMLQHVLTHEDSFADCVDPYRRYIEHGKYGFARYNRNEMLRALQDAQKTLSQFPNARLHRKPSHQYFRRCHKKYDIIYIDGNHSSDTVLEDAINAKRFLAMDGWLIFDDADLLEVRAAVNSFMTCCHRFFREQYMTKCQRCLVRTANPNHAWHAHLWSKAAENDK